MNDQNYSTLALIPVCLLSLWLYDGFQNLTGIDRALVVLLSAGILIFGIFLALHFLSPWGKTNRKRLEQINEIPESLLLPSENSIVMGRDCEMDESIYLPDQIRTRHIHILGATGSGKTESVILNFLRQDVQRGIGSIIMDAKGDTSFLNELYNWVPADRLRVFDLTDENSTGYDPLQSGSPLEAAQRLFSSLTWSEEYYKSKALSSLQRVFQRYFELNGKNPNLIDISEILETPNSFSHYVNSADFPQALALKDFQDLSGSENFRIVVVFDQHAC